MFDFRYHVASLVAVFLALIVGIVVGVGLSGQGILEEGERQVLNDRVEELRSERDAARTQLEEWRAAQGFVEAAYGAVMEGRLAERQIVLLFLGSADSVLRSAITEAVADAGGTVARFRAVRLPADEAAVASALESPDMEELGQELGEELIAGAETPLWDALAGILVLERDTRSDEPADAVVVARTVEPQGGETARLLRGLYEALSGSIPAVWIDTGTEVDPRRPPGFSAVQNVRTPMGRIALAVLLAGDAEGVYGTADGADAVVPPIDPVEPPPDESE